MEEHKDKVKWPIKPSFISLRKGFDESSDNPENGLFYPDFIQGFLGSLANEIKIKQPLTMFQFVPQDFEVEEEGTEYATLISFKRNEIDSYCLNILGNRKLIRLNSGKQFPIKKCCRLFRNDRADNRTKCYIQDSVVTLFSDKRLKGKKPREFADILKTIVVEYNEHYNTPPKYEIKIASTRDIPGYIYYRCKYSDFDEYAFPVFFERDVIAVLMLGQLVPENFDKGFTFESEVSTKCYLKMKGYLHSLKYEGNEKDKIKIIGKRIKTLEGRVVDKVNIQKQRYINTTFATIKSSFLSNVSHIKSADSNGITEIEKHAGKALHEICESFANHSTFIRIYAINPNSLNREYRLFAKSDIDNNAIDSSKFKAGIQPILKKHFETNLDFAVIEEESRREVVNHFSRPEEIKPDDTLRYLPTLSDNVSFIIWKRYERWDEPDEIKEMYKDRLIDFYILISQTYATIQSIEDENILKNIIRIAGHEASQIIPTMLEFTNVFRRLESPQISNEIKSEKFRKGLEDLREQVLLVRDIYDKPRLAFGFIRLDKSWAHLSDILVQGAILYRPFAQDRCQQIPPPDEFANKVSIYIDNRYFGHIINNLLDNAVKYSYEGTNIDILAYQKNDELIIEVSGFGAQIKDEEPIYELYYRGDNQKHNQQGLGVGMFLSKRIAVIHGFDLSHRSSKVSDYHLPVLQARFFEYESIFSSIPRYLYDEVVAIKNKLPLYMPDKEEADLLIHSPTYNNQFFITIPHQSYRIININ